MTRIRDEFTTSAMGKCAKVLLLAVGLTAFCIVLVFAVRTSAPPEPSYNGRKLSEWLAIRDRTFFEGDTGALSRSNEAAHAIQAIGTNALPSTIEWLSYDPSPAQNLADTLAARFRKASAPTNQWPFFETVQEQKVAWAESFFVLVGTNASPAIPQLKRLIEHGGTAPARRAAFCIALIGTNAMPAINEMIATTNPAIRLRLLRNIGVAHKWGAADWTAAVPLLVRYADDTNVEVSFAAVESLGNIHKDPEMCIPVFTNKLRSTVLFVRHGAIIGLGAFGPGASNALPALVPMLKEPGLIRFDAEKAIRNIAPDDYTNIISAATN